MSTVNLHLKDKVTVTDTCNLSVENQQLIVDRMNAGPKKTRVRFIDHNTGEVLEDTENKILITGSQFNAMAVFGIDTPAVSFPTYNEEMALDNSAAPSATPANRPIVCLFSVSDGGCGSNPKDVYVTKYTDRIKPAPKTPSGPTSFSSDMIMPFRFVDTSADLDANLRKYYFGRKTFSSIGKIGYYFKKFDTDPQLHLRYADGTMVNSNIYNLNPTQTTECYVEMRLRITRLDLRDYFEYIGWDKARISSLSLNYGWYNTSGGYQYFQSIGSYSLLNFQYKELQDLTVAIDVLYEVFY